MRKSFVACAAAMMLAVNVPAAAIAADKPVELTPAELSTVQNQRIDLPSDMAFGATLATLQTLGYVDIQASRDAGTISGITESKAKVIYNIIWGLGKKKLTQKASLLIEPAGPTASLVRLNLHVNETKSRGIFGTSFSDGKLVRYRDPYVEFHNALTAEVARRKAGMAPVPAVTPAAAVTSSN